MTLAAVMLGSAAVSAGCWVEAALVQRRNRPFTDLLRWEHLAMGASLAFMVFFMN